MIVTLLPNSANQFVGIQKVLHRRVHRYASRDRDATASSIIIRRYKPPILHKTTTYARNLIQGCLFTLDCSETLLSAQKAKSDVLPRSAHAGSRTSVAGRKYGSCPEETEMLPYSYLKTNTTTALL